LIEEEGFTVKDALEAFKTARPDGIRHVRMILCNYWADFRFYFNFA
jgi:hypothetical protein